MLWHHLLGISKTRKSWPLMPHCFLSRLSNFRFPQPTTSTTGTRGQRGWEDNNQEQAGTTTRTGRQRLRDDDDEDGVRSAETSPYQRARWENEKRHMMRRRRRGRYERIPITLKFHSVSSLGPRAPPPPTPDHFLK